MGVEEQRAAPSPITFAPVLNALFKIDAALICFVCAIGRARAFV